ncbi:MAG: hypothetical protein ACOC0N_10465 [Chroococcales cyanobacterium]
MNRLIAIFVLILLLGLSWDSPVQAAICQETGKHRICLGEIKRSAKYFWEYRASVTIDGQKVPRKVYNCRDRLRYDKKGNSVPFEQGGAGELICGLVNQR